MKKYLSLEDFTNFLESLEISDKPTKLFSEDLEGEIYEYNFQKIQFNNNNIIIYDEPMGCIGIIQDTPVGPWQDYAESFFEYLDDIDNKLYIEM